MEVHYNSTCVELNDYLHDLGDFSTEPITAYIFGMLYTVIISAGLLGNSCVLLAVLRNRSLQTVPNMFIFSLSCSDILVCCFSATITPVTAFRKNWVFGEALCKAVPFFMGITLCFSTFTLASISVDRFLLIKFPMRKLLTKGRAILIIVFLLCVAFQFNCFLAALFSSPVVFKMGLIDGENITKTVAICGEFCDEVGWQRNERRIYGTVLLCVQFVLPFLIIFFCYSSILHTVKHGMHSKVRQNTYEWQNEVTVQQRAVTRRRQRTNRMLISMVVAFFASWVGNILFLTFKDYGLLPYVVVSQEFLYAITFHCIAMTSTVWNPLLYAVLNLQFREAFRELLPKQFLKKDFNFDAAVPLTTAIPDGISSYQIPNEKRNTLVSVKQYGFNDQNCSYEIVPNGENS